MTDLHPPTYALDIESTGVDAARDRIIELALIQVDDALDEMSRQVWRFNPTVPIPPPATRVHGITDEDVRNEPPFKARAPRIQRLLAGSTIIAYNGLRFDLPLLQRELVDAQQAGIAQSVSLVDPYRLFLPDSPRTLTDACRHYGAAVPGRAHAAEDDAAAMLGVLRCQVQSRPEARLQGLEAVREERITVDSGGWFYRRHGDGPIRLSRGKLKDTIAALHPSYLSWIARQRVPGDTRALARALTRAVAS